jgi:hypothetical protein
MFRRPALVSSLMFSLIATAAIASPPAALATETVPAPVAAAETPAQRSVRLQDRAEALQREADATYAADEAACRQRFQVNRCIDEAKARRLQTIRDVRALKAEVHQIELAERRRNAEAVQARPAAAAATPAAAAAAGAAPIAEHIRSERARSTEAKARAQAREQAGKDAARQTERARAEAAAAERAARAAAEREKYDRRRQQYEARQAGEAKQAGSPDAR